jgi:hypothetical protein
MTIINLAISNITFYLYIKKEVHMCEQQHLQGEFPSTDEKIPDLTGDKRYTSGNQKQEPEPNKQKITLAPDSGLGAFAGH